MTFTHRAEPVPGGDAKLSIDGMEELWCDSTGALNAGDADRLRCDLFQAIGMVRGLILALEVRSAEYVVAEGAQEKATAILSGKGK
mgnify:CR=1 FL=1